MVGRTFLHYEVLAPLGHGGFGRVFLAVDHRTGRKVALKFLDLTSHQQGKPSDLQREARAAARLGHPGIVALHSLEQCDGEWFLVEEYVEGENLQERLERGPFGSVELLRLARELTAALEHAHGHGVLHRDIKPANVLLTMSGQYKLADFGLARIVDSSRSDSAAMMGTLPYTAPERLRGHPGDARADLFSLGAVLYEAMSGRRAFAGTNEAEIVYAVLNQTPEPLAARSRALETVVETIDRLLAKEPADRPESAAQVAATLARDAPEPTPPRPRARRYRRLAISGAVVAVLAVVIALSSRRTDQGPIAVIEFRNLVDSRDPSRLGLITTNLLTSNLANSVGLSVLSAERVSEATQDLKSETMAGTPALIQKVALRTRAAWIVSGSILRTEPNLLMTAELSEASSGRIMEAVRVEVPRNQTIFDLADEVARRLAIKLVRFARPETLRGPPRRSTRDLVAYQRFVEGLEYMSEGNLGKAEIAFQHALKRDPLFQLAREQLSTVSWLKSAPYDREVQ